jgi:phosphopantetheinyl transferase (holo-ACP synthase)
VRLRRWLVAAPPQDVEITGPPVGPGSVRVDLGPYATVTVDLAAAHPPAPRPWRIDAPERDPGRTGPSIYTDRWMFHGPAFQGVTELTAIGDRHARAVLTVPPAPGALLDNVGQVIGVWIMSLHDHRRVVFPVAIDRITFHRPAPRPGERVGCVLRITDLTEPTVTADAQLSTRDGVWAEISGWRDRRFDSHPETAPAERFPETETMSAPRPGGYELLWDRWPDPASRELVLRHQLGAAERAAFEQQPPAHRSGWLAGRIAAKDAARRLLWTAGAGPVFPAELAVDSDPTDPDRVTVSGVHGRAVPALDVSVAHRGRAAVAIARCRTDGAGIGIDLQEVADAPDRTARSPAERAAAGAAADPATELTRCRAARRAVAKAERTDPGALAVRQVNQSELVVEVPGRATPSPIRRYRVCTDLLTAPADLPPGRYVVAWTAGLSEEGNRKEF